MKETDCAEVKRRKLDATEDTNRNVVDFEPQLEQIQPMSTQSDNSTDKPENPPAVERCETTWKMERKKILPKQPSTFFKTVYSQGMKKVRTLNHAHNRSLPLVDYKCLISVSIITVHVSQVLLQNKEMKMSRL